MIWIGNLVFKMIGVIIPTTYVDLLKSMHNNFDVYCIPHLIPVSSQ